MRHLLKFSSFFFPFFFYLTITQLVFASLGTCGNSGEFQCTTTDPGPANTVYQGSVAGSQCAINATKAGAAKGTKVYCCNAGSSTTTGGISWGTCTGNNGLDGADHCRDSCNSSDISYTDQVPLDQCSVNATRSNLPRKTPVYCECGQNGEAACPSGLGSSSTSSSVSSSSSSSTAQSAAINVIVNLPGVGGLNGGNIHPQTPTRTITVYLYTPTQDPTNVNDVPITVPGTVKLETTTGNHTYGYFTNTIPVGNLSGAYQIFVKTNQYLREQVVPSGNTGTNTFQLTPGQTTALPQVVMIPGDIAPSTPGPDGSFGDNVLDISDYNALLSCYKVTSNTTACPNWKAADLNDDGVVDGVDYNILLRSFNYLQQNTGQIH